MIDEPTPTGDLRAGPQSTSPRPPLSTAGRVVIGAIACLAVAAATATVAVESGRVPAEVVARYPRSAAQEVPDTAEIQVKLQVGWFKAQKRFDIVVTGSDGRIVAGHSALDNADVLSFIPDEPLPAGKYAVEVHERGTSPSDDNILDWWSFTVEAAPTLSDGAGGSIILVAREGTRDSYLAEILRAEGFTGFDTVTPDEVSTDLLANHAVVILGAMSSTGPHLSDLVSWVLGGGELITMRPEGQLAALAGLNSTGETLADGYVEIHTEQAPGLGLTPDPLQFHGDALLYTSGPEGRTVATLSADREHPGSRPAVTLTDVGNSGGHIAAFSYDLATSVMYTRQGNPAAAGTERDGSAPIRPDDLFIGSDGEPDYLDLANIGIPQADEQMRLLSNVLEELHSDTAPLPRFWYLPNGEKAALVMAGDDHGTKDGTRRFFERMKSLSPPGCDVKQWECPRATAWMDPLTPFTAEEAEHYSELGFDLGSHVSTHCSNWNEESLDAAFAIYLLEFRRRYPTLPDQTGNRIHCVAYSNWLGLPTEEQQWGIRLDMNYYNWPPGWIQGRPGYITGSALPMRFSDANGRMLDVFQQESHLVNETWKGSTAAIEALITAARDKRGYYGAFGTHFDFSDDFDQKLTDIAVRRHVPMVSAQQLLAFTEGRQASTFTNVQMTGIGNLTFDVDVDQRADGMLWGMLPVDSRDRVLTSLTANGHPVSYDIELIKGINYALFEVDDLRYEASYG